MARRRQPAGDGAAAAVAPAGPLGYGWSFPFDAYLRMYAEFALTEFRGAERASFRFEPANPDEALDSFDGDSLIF